MQTAPVVVEKASPYDLTKTNASLKARISNDFGFFLASAVIIKRKNFHICIQNILLRYLQ